MSASACSRMCAQPLPGSSGWLLVQELSPRVPQDLGRALHPFPHAHAELDGAPSIASAIATRYSLLKGSCIAASSRCSVNGETHFAV